jgi:hypothetical protein
VSATEAIFAARINAVLSIAGRRIKKLRVRKLEAEINEDEADEKQKRLARRGH